MGMILRQCLKASIPNNCIMKIMIMFWSLRKEQQLLRPTTMLNLPL